MSDARTPYFIPKVVKGSAEGVEKMREKFNDAMQRANSADARNGEGVAIPDGWKLVPVEPTQEMAKAYLNLSMKSWRQSYIAMLDAAPAAPAPTEDEIEAQDKSIADAATMKLMFINVMAAFATGRNLEAQLHAAYDWCERSGMVKKYSTMERAASAPAPAAQADEPPFTGHWRGGNGVISCGTLRVFSENFDTNPADHIKAGIVKWVCDTLNAAQRQQSATPPECTCPSGNGSLRHPCPVHAVGAAKVMCGCGDQYPMDSYEAGFIEGRGHCENCDAMSATPADAASEADTARVDFHIEQRTTWYPDRRKNGNGVMCYGVPRHEVEARTWREAIDAAIQRERQQGADRGD